MARTGTIGLGIGLAFAGVVAHGQVVLERPGDRGERAPDGLPWALSEHVQGYAPGAPVTELLGGPATVCDGNCEPVFSDNEIINFANGIDSVNGGCTPHIPWDPQWVIIAPFQMCGVTGRNEQYRDTDWYETRFVPGVTTELRVRADYPVRVGVIGYNGEALPLSDDVVAYCAQANELVGEVLASDCVEQRSTFRVPVDAHYSLYIAPQDDAPVGVGSYRIEMYGTPDPCEVCSPETDHESVPFERPEPGSCIDMVNSGCVEGGGLLFDELRLDHWLCGASYREEAGCLDEDWFLIDLPVAGEYKIEVRGRPLVDVWFFHSRPFDESFCSDMGGRRRYSASGCLSDDPRTGTFSIDTPGKYVVWAVMPDEPLDSQGEYSIRISNVCGVSCLGTADIDQDGAVGLTDLQELLYFFGLSVCAEDTPVVQQGTPPCIDCVGDTESVPGEIKDLDTCKDAVNGGCFDESLAFDVMRVGTPMCGALNRAPTGSPSCWDLDWFLIDIPFDDVFMFELASDWRAVGGFVRTDSGMMIEDPETWCDSSIFAIESAASTLDSCRVESGNEIALEAGTYVVTVSAQNAPADSVGEYSALVTPACHSCAGPGDITGDGKVDLDDLQQMLSLFGSRCD